jgi:hypothetical protein
MSKFLKGNAVNGRQLFSLNTYKVNQRPLFWRKQNDVFATNPYRLTSTLASFSLFPQVNQDLKGTLR